MDKSGHSDIKFLSFLLSHLHMNAAYHISGKGYSRSAKTHTQALKETVQVEIQLSKRVSLRSQRLPCRQMLWE